MEPFEGDNVVSTVVAETGSHDLTVIGAGREWVFQQLVFGAIPEEVGQPAESTVIMTKRPGRLTSAFREWVHW